MAVGSYLPPPEDPELHRPLLYGGTKGSPPPETASSFAVSLAFWRETEWD